VDDLVSHQLTKVGDVLLAEVEGRSTANPLGEGAHEDSAVDLAHLLLDVRPYLPLVASGGASSPLDMLDLQVVLDPGQLLVPDHAPVSFWEHGVQVGEGLGAMVGNAQHPMVVFDIGEEEENVEGEGVDGEGVASSGGLRSSIHHDVGGLSGAQHMDSRSGDRADKGALVQEFSIEVDDLASEPLLVFECAEGGGRHVNVSATLRNDLGSWPPHPPSDRLAHALGHGRAGCRGLADWSWED